MVKEQFILTKKKCEEWTFLREGIRLEILKLSNDDAFMTHEKSPNFYKKKLFWSNVKTST